MGGEDSRQCCSWRTRRSHICMQINWEEQLGSETDPPPRVPAQGNKASEPLTGNTCGGSVAGEIPSLAGESVGRTHRILERIQAHPPRNQHQKGPTCLWEAEEVTESWQRAEQTALFCLGPLPHIQCHNTASQHSKVGCLTLVNT